MYLPRVWSAQLEEWSSSAKESVSFLVKSRVLVLQDLLFSKPTQHQVDPFALFLFSMRATLC